MYDLRGPADAGPGPALQCRLQRLDQRVQTAEVNEVHLLAVGLDYCAPARTMGPTAAKGGRMASSAEYLEYVLDLLADVPDVTTRKMMGEYLLYASGKLFGGVYDDRFLVRDTAAARAVLSTRELPYDGAQEMLVVDIESREAVAELVAAMLPELPEPKRRR